MASFACPQCKRFVDDTMRSCPGCKMNIKKYVKEMKKNGMSIGGLSLNSVYNKAGEAAPVTPALDFLRPAAPEPIAPVAAPAPEYTAPAATAPAAPAYSAPAAPAPAPAYSAPAAPTPAPAYSAPVAPTPAPAYSAPVAPTPAPAYSAPVAPTAAPAYSAPAATTPAPAYSAPAAPAPAAPEVVFESPSLNRKPDAPKFVAPKYEKPINQQAGANVGNRTNSSTPWSAAPAAQENIGNATGPFESAILNNTTVGSGGGALSGMFSKPTVMEQIRAEKEKERAEASIFESATLRAQEKAINSGEQQPLGGLHGNMSIAEFMEQQKLTNSYNNRRNYTAAPDVPKKPEEPTGPAQISDKPTYEELAKAYGGAAAQTSAPSNPYLQQQVITSRPSGPYNSANQNPFLAQTAQPAAPRQTSGPYNPTNNNPFLQQGAPTAPTPTSGPYGQQPTSNTVLGENQNPLLGGGA